MKNENVLLGSIPKGLLYLSFRGKGAVHKEFWRNSRPWIFPPKI